MEKLLMPPRALLMIRSTATLTVVLLFALNTSSGAERKDKPNIIVILTDDQGYNDVGFHGCPDIPTPHIDELARAGVTCTDGYVTCPVCAPTRAGLLTGRYQQRSGFEDNAWNPKAGLSTKESTIADYLKGAGYATLAIGKWHVGQLPQFRPLKRGFTDHYGFLGGGRSFLPKQDSLNVPFVPKDPDQIDLWRNETRVDDPPYLTDAFGDEAVSYIGKHKNDPFFIYLAFNAPHVPLQATQEYLDRFPDLAVKQRRTYAAMISAVDDAVGKINDKLHVEGLEQNTLIFFLSDNGGHPQANTGNNAPLRGEKGTVWEGGIRVPFVVKWTGHLPAGKKYSEPVVSLDIAATALAPAGVSTVKKPLDGVNLIPYLSGQKSGPPHKTLYWRFVDQWAVRHGNWKLTVPQERPVAGEPLFRFRNAPAMKLQAAPALYDLSMDIAESKDLSAEHPETVKQLQTFYDKWNSELPPARSSRRRRNAAAPESAAPQKP